MSLRPLGHRILITPDAPQATSASGLELPQDRHHIPTSGVVAEIGPGGPQGKYRTRQRAIQDCVEVVESAIQMFGAVSPLLIVRENIAGLLGTGVPDREIQVGDRVAYGVEVGLTLVEDGKEYVIVNEDDVCVVVEEAAA